MVSHLSKHFAGLVLVYPIERAGSLHYFVLYIIAFSSAAFNGEVRAVSPRPNVVILLADDLGWNDVSYHGSEIQTPHIDRLVESGACLDQFYVQPICSPTRTALMTGRYPMRSGMHARVVRPWHTKGLPLEERLLPEALRDAGYSTAICGKWHLGMADPAYLPLARGFDHQYGHIGGHIDYFKHTYYGALDWHRDQIPLQENGYTTELIADEAVKILKEHDLKKPLFLLVSFNAPHSPQQVPNQYLLRNKHITNKRRQTYAGMVSCMDDMIGRIVDTLGELGLRENTLIFFCSDNGGATNTAANNEPLRGHKGQLYEGGIRVPAAAVWRDVISPGTIIDEPLHIVDIYPTLICLAGGTLKQPLPIDGRDAWLTIAEGASSPHEAILFNALGRQGAIRQGNWKLVRNGMKASQPPVIELFDLSKDPNEKQNVATQQLQKVAELTMLLDEISRVEVEPDGLEPNEPADFRALKCGIFSSSSIKAVSKAFSRATNTKH